MPLVLQQDFLSTAIAAQKSEIGDALQTLTVVAAGLVFLGGCAAMDQRQRSTVTGGAIGAGAGAIIGNQVGRSRENN